MGAAVSPEQIIALRVLAFAVSFLFASALIALWWLLIAEFRRHGINAVSILMSAVTVAVTVIVGALGYLVAVY